MSVAHEGRAHAAGAEARSARAARPASRPSLRLIHVAQTFGILALLACFWILADRTHRGHDEAASRAVRHALTMSEYHAARGATLQEASAVAGYAILGDEAFLKDFEAATASAEAALDTVERLASAGDAQSASLAALMAAHEAYAREYAQILDRLAADDVTGAAGVASPAELYAGGVAIAADLQQAAEDEEQGLIAAQHDMHAAAVLTHRVALGAVAALAIFGLLAGLVVFQWVVRPIERIGEAARVIAAGDESARAPIEGTAEVARLASDVNQMADTLLARSRRIEEYLSANLEKRAAELERANVALGESESRFRALVQNSADIIVVVERGGPLHFASPAFRRLLGYAWESADIPALLSIVHPDDRALATQSFRQAMDNAGIHAKIELRVRHVDGSWRTVEAVATNLLGDPAVRGIVYNCRDITERRQAELKLTEMAEHDALTGLANRRRIHHELARCIADAKARGAVTAFAFLDIDQFKDVNDSLGHGVGDELLSNLGALLRSEIRDGDVVGRLGGDEFAIIMPGTSAAAAHAASERLLEAIRREPFATSADILRVTGSLGVSAFPDHGSSVEELMSAADLAMYRSKNDGRNRVTCYLEHMGSPTRPNLLWQNRLRQALELNQFVLSAQPIVDLATGHVVMYELLLRLRREDGTLLLPSTFLSTADRLGLLHEIDRWVVRQAVRALKASRDAGTPVRIAANLSPRAFGDPGITEAIQDEAAAVGIEPAGLVLELTEDAAIRDIEQARVFMQELRAIGCEFALDDFGVGLSSLSRLKDLPVDYLKIDGAFIRRLAHSSLDQQLVQGIVGLARALGTWTVAEHVEDAESLELLRAYGVDYAQGYLLGEPLPMSRWLQQVRAAA